MPKHSIINYTLGWDLKRHQGVFTLQSANGTWTKPGFVKDPNEFAAISDLLRNERPLFFDEENLILHTRMEEVGEGE